MPGNDLQAEAALGEVLRAGDSRLRVPLPPGPRRLREAARRRVRWYNTERPHRMLEGRTPLAAWQEDEAPLHRIDADKLRHLLLAGDERTIQEDGIHLGGHAYAAPETHGRGAQVVQIDRSSCGVGASCIGRFNRSSSADEWLDRAR
ncbi:hypothetical protein ACH4LT_16000 [Streptomyces clavifer]|uniref:hypothetical protein n=1 Tax=Streptomyces clavifer TaxID=68188 RepID=UPI0037A6AAF1